MEPGSQIPANQCRCGAVAARGSGDHRILMVCPICRSRWLVKRCACGAEIDFRFQQFCSSNRKQCDLKPYNICVGGMEAVPGTGSIEGMMFCQESDCSCHHSRWAFHRCEHCGCMVDYRYAAICMCKECVKSRQFWRICPVCGNCPSVSHQLDHSEIVRNSEQKSDRVEASKAVACSCHLKQQELGL